MNFPNEPVIKYFQSFPVTVIWHSVKNNLEQSGECVLWTGQKLANKSGFVTLNKQRIALRRYVWSLHNGAIEPEQFVRNTCENPNCLKPEHLQSYKNSIGRDTDSLMQECVRLYRSNLKIKQICELLQLSRSWIEQLLSQARTAKLLLPIEAEGVELNEIEQNYYRNLGYAV